MDAINLYKIIHVTGIALIAFGTGGMLANGTARKSFATAQGIGLLVMLVSGFGLLARLGLGFPGFAIAKTVLWLVIGTLPVIFRKLKPPLGVAIAISLTLVAVMAWLGLTHGTL